MNEQTDPNTSTIQLKKIMPNLYNPQVNQIILKRILQSEAVQNENKTSSCQAIKPWQAGTCIPKIP